MFFREEFTAPLKITLSVKQGEWNDVYINWEGNDLKVRLNSEKTLEFTTEISGVYHSQNNLPIRVRVNKNKPESLIVVNKVFEIILDPSLIL